MAETVRQTEYSPAEYPDPPEGLSPEAAALDPEMVWGRIEAYIAWRWGVRTVEWIVDTTDRDETWYPPLRPVLIDTVEEWSSADAWALVIVHALPGGGFRLPGSGQYRFVASVGTVDDPPAMVLEAYRRLAEYLAAVTDSPGARSESVPDVGQVEYDNRARARALQDSGAADLLRSYRRA